MKIFVEVDEAAERLQQLIELAVRDDQVLTCRARQLVASLTAILKPAETFEEVWALAAEERVNVPRGTTSSHDDFYDGRGLPG